MPFAVLFPGQGSQFTGMGADLFKARPDLLGSRAAHVLGWSLEDVCLHGPEELLTRTEHAQPALFAVGYALWEELRAGLPALPSAAAGHSLGEYTALAAASAIDFDQALEVVAERGQAMADAADLEPSGMAAVIGAEFALLEEVCSRRREEGGRLYVANINAPGQIVVAGADEDLAWLGAECANLGLRKVIPLKVAGAFHSPFMESAARRVGHALESAAFHPPSFPVWANVSAAPFTAGSEVELLTKQIVEPVLFSDSIAAMVASGVDLFIHVGPGDVTAGMAKRTAPTARTAVVSDLAGIPSVMTAIVTIS